MIRAFRLSMHCLWVLVFALAFTGAANAARPWADASRLPDVTVVTAPDASDASTFAAQQFQHYWAQSTGNTPPLVHAPEQGKINVLIGPEVIPDSERAALKGLGPDGIYIRTLPVEGRRFFYRLFDNTRARARFPRTQTLVISGAGPRGTLNAVYQFLHDYLGVRWLAPEVTHVPGPPENLPKIAVRYVPPIFYRDSNYHPVVASTEYALAHHMNGTFAPIPLELGGNIGFANAFGHTVFSFVSPEEYGASHPEYFSMIDGKRVTTPNATQLCLSNPDVLRIVIEKTKALLRNSPPNKRIVSITQMDWGWWCECPACKALDEEEGSHSGTMIHFVNQVADAIKDEFPDAYIDTFAYTYTRKPPKHLKPRDNVIVRLCSIECDFSKPLSDKSSPANRSFQKDINGWARITKNLFIWDYTQNWYAFQGPHPNIQVLQPNIAFYRDKGVKGIFEQASPSASHADFEYLKAYIITSALWNPDVDWHQLYDEFLTLYYGPAAPYIREYHELITNKVLSSGYVLGIFSHMEWMDYDMVVKAQAIFSRAFEVVKDPVYRERLQYAYLPVQYSALVCPPRVEITEDAYILTRPPSQTFDEYWDMIMGYGVTYLADDPIEKFRERLHGQTPPRYQKLPFAKLVNDQSEVWVVPAMGGEVARWRDKTTGADLFAGYTHPTDRRFALQEWEVMDPNAPKPEEAWPADYSVVSQEPDTIVLRSTPRDGIVITRTVSLPAGSSAFQVSDEIQNISESPVIPWVKIHPEFHLPSPQAPELWVEQDGHWTNTTPGKAAERPVNDAQRIDPKGITRWAFFDAKAKLGVLSTVQSAQLDSLFYYYNVNDRQVNLETVPLLTPLAPGASRRVEVSYEAVRTRPADLR